MRQLRSQLAGQPRLGRAPLPFGRRAGHVEHFGCLFQCAAGKRAQFDEVGEAAVDLLQPRDQILQLENGDVFGGVQVQGFSSATRSNLLPRLSALCRRAWSTRIRRITRAETP